MQTAVPPPTVDALLTRTRAAAAAPRAATPTGAAGGAAGWGPVVGGGGGNVKQQLGPWGHRRRVDAERLVMLVLRKPREMTGELLGRRPARPTHPPSPSPPPIPCLPSHPYTHLRIVRKALPAVQRGVVGQQLHVARAQHPIQAQLRGEGNLLKHLDGLKSGGGLFRKDGQCGRLRMRSLACSHVHHVAAHSLGTAQHGLSAAWKPHPTPPHTPGPTSRCAGVRRGTSACRWLSR